MKGSTRGVQTRVESLIEQVISTLIGFIVSLGVWYLIVIPLFNLEMNTGTSTLIVCIFTFFSVLRGYVVRRFFETKLHKIAHKLSTRWLSFVNWLSR